MPGYALFLRGVNVGGHNKVPMTELRSLIGSLGFTGARTIVQSGNAVFRGAVTPVPALEKRFETAIAESLGVTCECVVRTDKDWPLLMKANPFMRQAKADPARMVVVLLKDAPASRAINDVRAAIKGREIAELKGHHLYVVYPDGQGTSKFTLPVIERALGTVGTARNWNTIVKVAELLQG